MYHYALVIELGDEQHACGVEIPDLPGCFSAGDSLDEAIRNAYETIALHLESAAEDGELPPIPSDIATIQASAETDRVLAIASIDESPYMGKSTKFNVTLPELLAKQIDDVTKANPNYSNRSQFLQIAAKKELETIHKT